MSMTKGIISIKPLPNALYIVRILAESDMKFSQAFDSLDQIKLNMSTKMEKRVLLMIALGKQYPSNR